MNVDEIPVLQYDRAEDYEADSLQTVHESSTYCSSDNVSS